LTFHHGNDNGIYKNNNNTTKNTTIMNSNPCDKVRESCAALMASKEAAEHVTIHGTALVDLADRIRMHSTIVVWDEEAWHYQPPLQWPHPIRKERMALYILALDAINFCFWPAAGYEYQDLAASLTAACQADHAVQEAHLETVSTAFALTAAKLQRMTVETMTALFRDHHVTHQVPPDMAKRCQLWNEVGRGLETASLGGSAVCLVERANGSAVALVQLLIDTFPGFRDYLLKPTTTLAADTLCCPLYFLKRAQICVGDWNAALQLDLSDLSELTTFADYRVPQLLRHWKVLQYSNELAAAVDSQQELVVASSQEISIRAATVQAVELLVQELNRETIISDNKPWTAVQTDWYLWQVGERLQAQGELKPHHRVRTIYY
jgi:hypothetical protein